MKKQIKQLFRLIIILHVSVLCYAQDEMKGYFQTPNASSLGVLEQMLVSSTLYRRNILLLILICVTYMSI